MYTSAHWGLRGRDYVHMQPNHWATDRAAWATDGAMWVPDGATRAPDRATWATDGDTYARASWYSPISMLLPLGGSILLNVMTISPCGREEHHRTTKDEFSDLHLDSQRGNREWELSTLYTQHLLMFCKQNYVYCCVYIYMWPSCHPVLGRAERLLTFQHHDCCIHTIMTFDCTKNSHFEGDAQTQYKAKKASNYEVTNLHFLNLFFAIVTSYLQCNAQRWYDNLNNHSALVPGGWFGVPVTRIYTCFTLVTEWWVTLLLPCECPGLRPLCLGRTL